MNDFLVVVFILSAVMYLSHVAGKLSAIETKLDNLIAWANRQGQPDHEPYYTLGGEEEEEDEEEPKPLI